MRPTRSLCSASSRAISSGKNGSPVVSSVFNPVAAFLTTGGMPPSTRELLGLPWSVRQERRYKRFASLWRSRPVNWLWDHLPMQLRYNKFAHAGYGHS